MSDHVYKLTELVGTSHEGTDDAIRSALDRAGKTIRNIRWYKVTGQRGHVEADGTLQF